MLNLNSLYLRYLKINTYGAGAFVFERLWCFNLAHMYNNKGSLQSLTTFMFILTFVLHSDAFENKK